MTYKIGQTFEGTYPPDAAVWCNENDMHIEFDGGFYVIVQNTQPTPTPEQLCSEYRAELNSTDWYVIREIDTGVPCPDEIKTRRAWLRSEIERLEA